VGGGGGWRVNAKCVQSDTGGLAVRHSLLITFSCPNKIHSYPPQYLINLVPPNTFFNMKQSRDFFLLMTKTPSPQPEPQTTLPQAYKTLFLRQKHIYPTHHFPFFDSSTSFYRTRPPLRSFTLKFRLLAGGLGTGICQIQYPVIHTQFSPPPSKDIGRFPTAPLLYFSLPATITVYFHTFHHRTYVSTHKTRLHSGNPSINHVGQSLNL